MWQVNQEKDGECIVLSKSMAAGGGVEARPALSLWFNQDAD